jgi:hypothetical protein
VFPLSAREVRRDRQTRQACGSVASTPRSCTPSCELGSVGGKPKNRLDNRCVGPPCVCVCV